MTATEFLPADTLDLEALRSASATCKGCELYRHASQTVFGAGDPKARVLFVGEQPGDREDREGEPFVGPAGRLLHSALEEAGIDRNRVYITNAVKHFKWEPRGKLRLHKKPSTHEVAACQPWLMAEIRAVRPEVVVCLGATAAQSLLGSRFRVLRERGRVFDGPDGSQVTATVHPSAILRAPDVTRAVDRAQFVEDLRTVARTLS